SPPRSRGANRNGVYGPWSTIGNLEPEDASDFLQKIADMVGNGRATLRGATMARQSLALPGNCLSPVGGGLLMGVDLKKSKAILERAYNDGAGVTAQFT